MSLFQPEFVLRPLCVLRTDSLIIGLHSALVYLYECAQRKMNEILIHEGKRKLVPWHCCCVLFDVNGEHIVRTHNGIFRLQTEAMMDGSLSSLHKQTLK